MRRLIVSLVLAVSVFTVWKVAEAVPPPPSYDVSRNISRFNVPNPDAGGFQVCPPAGQAAAKINCPVGTKTIGVQNTDTSRYCYYNGPNLTTANGFRFKSDAIWAPDTSELYCICDGNGTTDAGLAVRVTCGQ